MLKFCAGVVGALIRRGKIDPGLPSRRAYSHGTPDLGEDEFRGPPTSGAGMTPEKAVEIAMRPQHVRVDFEPEFGLGACTLDDAGKPSRGEGRSPFRREDPTDCPRVAGQCRGSRPRMRSKPCLIVAKRSSTKDSNSLSVKM